MNGQCQTSAQWFDTSRWKRVLLAFGVLAAAVFIFAVWYRMHYSMDTARSFEAAGAASGPRVLIATQGSDFKDALTTGLVDHLHRRSAYVRVIDVSGLQSVQQDEWDAIVVIHTWEMRKPPSAVRAFIDRMQRREKLAVLTTSGAGHFKLEGVDAISAASQMSDVPARVTELSAKVDRLLDARSSPIQ